MKVIGIGEKKTPTPFISACDKFIYLEILKPVEVIRNRRSYRMSKQKLMPKLKNPKLLYIMKNRET